MRPLAWSALIVSVACSQPRPQPTPGPLTGGTSGGVPVGTTAGSTTSTAETGTTTTATTTPVDCTSMPVVPAPYTTLTGYSTAEDFDFDAAGYTIAEYNRNLAGKDQTGAVKLVSADVGDWTAGTRTLQTGDFVVAVPSEGALKLIDGVTGGQTIIGSGLAYPNGVEVDSLDNVYTADQDTGRVLRVNAYNTADMEVVATGLQYPNGLILSPDETILYVGSFGGGMIYAIDRDLVNGGWEDPRILVEHPGFDMGFDGINVDRCGNVYWTEYIRGKVWRAPPDGSTVDLVADLPSSWIPNLRWGHDVGGWSNDVLYVSDRDQGRIFAIEVGILGKKHVLMP